MNIGIIPARGGCKRIPRKNIRQFAGKPMIAYAISAARTSGMFEHVVVSTDDPEIARVALEWGAETPFVRPFEFADDHTPTLPVIAHAIATCEILGWQIGQACCVYPGVPFIQAADLVAALELLESSGADYSFPVTESPRQCSGHSGVVPPVSSIGERGGLGGPTPAYTAPDLAWSFRVGVSSTLTPRMTGRGLN
jgi:CMP-N-acetylneuraminic acid synthetase